MNRNYFKTAFRNLIRHKSYTIINLLGLTVGLSTTIFILLWIQDEVTFDRFNKDINQIYEVFEHQTYSADKIYTFAATPGPLAEGLQTEFPEVELAARSNWGDRSLFQYNDNSFYAEGRLADSTLLQIFTFSWVEGNPESPMPDQSSIVINTTLSGKLFGGEKALGKVIRFRNQIDLKVTGVFKDLPANSSLQCEYVVPFFYYEIESPWLESWGNNGIMTFVKLKPAIDMHEFNEKIADYIKTKNEESVVTLFLHPLKDLRLYSDFENGELNGGRITYVKAFAYVAVFILVIACINFMNLTTARSAIRSREVGVRKVIGAQRSSIVKQFLGESFLVTFLAMMISLILVILLMGVFNDLTGKDVSLDLTDYKFWIGFILILFVTGILSGSYPAFFLSSFKPIAVLKNQPQNTLKGGRLRKLLVIIQFSLSVILIVSALVIYKQILYLQNKHLGFDKENVLYFYDTRGFNTNYDAFRNEALGQSFISGISKASHLPYQVGSSSSGMKWDGKPEDLNILFQTYHTDYDLGKVLDFELLDGRYFSRDHATDSTNYMINEEAAKRMGMDQPVGQNLEVWERKGQIIGLVKDFHSTSLYSPIEPLILMMNPKYHFITYVRIQAGKTKEAVTFLESLYKKYVPEFPFEYDFLDKSYTELYKSEMTIGKLADYFTGIAIFISCLGLYGLASFTVERRTKEISIRKVFGAPVSKLVSLLSKEFAWLILIAILFGSPIAWYLMNEFLSSYAFHVDMGYQVFILTAAGIFVLALLTVAYKSIHASMCDPAKSLRNE
jgi:ABC-type antimicrobial peptide transport system permease subunit